MDGFDINSGQIDSDIATSLSMIEPTINQHDNPKPNEEVFKVGRTTGLTTGYVNPVTSTRLIGVRKLRGGNTLMYETVEAQLVVNALHSDQREEAGERTETFSSLGDSGSAIFARDGCFKGLLFGGCEKSDRHYFTPVDVLFEDIKRKTGAVEIGLIGA